MRKYQTQVQVSISVPSQVQVTNPKSQISNLTWTWADNHTQAKLISYLHIVNAMTQTFYNFRAVVEDLKVKVKPSVDTVLDDLRGQVQPAVEAVVDDLKNNVRRYCKYSI